MRKGLIVLLVVVLAAAFAMPVAAADLKASGFYRSKAWMSNFFGRSLSTDADDATAAFVEQRFRVKFDFGNENVKAVWYLESDMYFGDYGGGTPIGIGESPAIAGQSFTYTGGASRNVGGALGADRIQTETKNIYVWFKIPDTSVSVQVGLQGQSDDYANFIYGADMAGIFVTGKYEPVSYKLGWAKLYENAPKETDDMTLYTASVTFVPGKDAKLGLNLYFLQNDTARAACPGDLPTCGATGTSTGNLLGYPYASTVWMPGVDGAIKAGPATISGFFVYQWGTMDAQSSANKDVDINAYIIDARADMNLGPGKFFVEGLYTSGGDDPTDKYEAPITLATNESSPGGNSAFSRPNMHILISSPDTIGVSQCLIGCSGGVAGADPGNGGRGIWLLAAGYSQKLTEKMKGEFNIGYLSATDTLKSDNSNMKDGMGTEFNARVDYNLHKGLDVGVIGAYALVGDFFKDAAGKTPDDVYMAVARVNYSF
jgi:hypothetical protein